MPGLTVATDGRPASSTSRGASASRRRASATSSQSPSPSRPPVSPITPTFTPAQPATADPANPATAPHSAIPDFALGRPAFTHTTQTDQVAMAPPQAPPIDFESNPDVLALKSAISILQLQRTRARADIQSLSRARDAALAQPEAFVADLAAGRVRVEGDPLFSAPRAGAVKEADSASDSDSDSDSDFEADSESDAGDDNPGGKQEETPELETKARGDIDTPMIDGAGASSGSTSKKPKGKSRGKGKHKGKQRRPSGPAAVEDPAPPWQKLPKPQSVVRCPPINWAQYGVVGESLDKLHAEQLAAPTPGAPAVLGPGGTYEFKAGAPGTLDQGGAAAPSASGGEQPRRLVGIAAPYNPLKDKVEKKGKGAKR